MRALKEYETEDGVSPFARWLDRLNDQTAARITRVLTRLKEGYRTDTETVGQGVHECRIHFGPGYRVYFANDGPELILLLNGGTKKRQSKDIRDSQDYWKDYKRRKLERRI
jgi:putative addiction module killer protein